MKRLTNLYLAAAVAVGTLGASAAQAQYYAPPPPPGAYHHWHPGDRYDGRRHVVEHWRDEHLPRPPHGAVWVDDHGHFVLVRGDGVILRVWGE